MPFGDAQQEVVALLLVGFSQYVGVYFITLAHEGGHMLALLASLRGVLGWRMKDDTSAGTKPRTTTGLAVLTLVIFFVASGLYLVAPVSIVRDIGLRHRVDKETMFGALAAYLLIWMAFGFGYECIALLQSGPLFVDGGDPPLSDALFWWTLALSLALAFVVTTPVNRWMISRGKRHAVAHRYH